MRNGMTATDAFLIDTCLFWISWIFSIGVSVLVCKKILKDVGLIIFMAPSIMWILLIIKGFATWVCHE